MSSAAARGAVGWLVMHGGLRDAHEKDLEKERLIREKKESAAPRVTGPDKAIIPDKDTPAARAPVVVYKRRRRVAA